MEVFGIATLMLPQVRQVTATSVILWIIVPAEMSPERLLQVEELYHAARQNRGVLASVDPALRLEVESLLTYDAAALPPLALDGLLVRDLPSEPIEEPVKAGSVVGPYVIEGRLGAGGMGVVFRARDTKLDRSVAIKFLSGKIADATAGRRLQREAQLASSLNHPHILTVHDVGEQEGQQYLVTEFVDGGTLQDWAKAERRTWRQIVELLVGVADGLAAAHGAGILHRDIKPTNILVAKNGYAKLADFGLAKIEDGVRENQALTQSENEPPTGHIIGTIQYLCPEAAQGRSVDARSDIFSFGVVLYEMLSGQRPFDAESDIGLLVKIVSSAPAALPPDLPAGLRMIVEKALEKEPADRYQTARDLVVDLRREVRVKSQPLAREGDGEGARRPFWPWIVLAAALAVTLAWAAMFFWTGRRDSPASPVVALNASLLPPPATSFVFAHNGDGGFAISPERRDARFCRPEPRQSAVMGAQARRGRVATGARLGRCISTFLVTRFALGGVLHTSQTKKE